MSFEVRAEALEQFAVEHVDVAYNDLEPWCSNRYFDFQIARARVGGESTAAYEGGFTAPSFDFEPMTVEDFERLTCVSLDPANDPGGPPNLADWITNYNLWDMGADDGGSSAYENRWFLYYQAKELDGKAQTFEPPGDAPWASTIEDGWNTSVENRLAEVDVLRGELVYLMEALIVAADAYADTDLTNSIDIANYESPDESQGDD